jgi:phosphoribosyl 1,2-cyclic phosphodiesterase
MSLYIASLNSGSNGNCYYVANQREAVLVDVGISCREVERRMARLQLSLNKVKAIFISHEHSDHIKGLSVLSKKYRLPVYITEATYRHSGLSLQEELIRSFKGYETVQVGGLAVKPFPKEHDCADPHSFLVSGSGINIGVFTDIGSACSHITDHFAQCHAAFLEANYDETMLEEGQYPWYLKNRIRSGKGHLSNTQALALFKAHKPPFMSRLLLSHLSRDNNSPQLVEQLFRNHAEGVAIAVASRDYESPVYHVCPVENMSSLREPGIAVQGVLF